MRKQLWFRLLLGTSFALIVAVTTAGLVLHRSATSSFEDYIDDVAAVRTQRIEALLSRYYGRRQEWTGVEPLVQQISDLVGQPVVLADSSDQVIADTQSQLIGQTVRESWKQQIVPVRYGDVAVGTLYIDPLHAPNKLGPRGDAFLAELTTSLLSALGVGLLAALAVSLLVARRLADPLETFTRFVRRIERGDRTPHIDASIGGEIGHLADAFNSLVHSLARVEELRQNMVNDIAHELRTPLSTVQGYIEAIQDGIAEPTPEVLEIVHRELMQLTRLVDDLRDLALAEARQLYLSPVLTSVDDLIAHDLRAFAVSADDHQVTVITSIDSDVPQIRVDPGRFSQVLRNLLNNALSHTPNQGEITVSATFDGTRVFISVQDTGPGIAEADLPHVFERFYRGDRSRSRRAGGAGLGLTISRELVAAHGGNLSVRNEPGTGACFTIALPLDGPPTSPRREANRASERADTPRRLGWLRSVARLSFYALMCGGLAGMLGGVSESAMVASVNHRPIEITGLAAYAMIIDALAIGFICATFAALFGVFGIIRGQTVSFRQIAPAIGPLAIAGLGAVLALKWSQLAGRESLVASAAGGQVIIAGGTFLAGAVAFAALSTSSRWRDQPVAIARRLVPGLAMLIGTIAFVGVVRDLSDRGFQGPRALTRGLHEIAQVLLPGSGSLDPLAGGPSVSLANASAAPKPNVLLITVDALRADHLGAYGYQSAHTPTMDSIARDGWRMDMSFTPRVGSSAAHAALFSGTFPDQNGVRTNMLDTLDHNVPTIAEILRSNGYTTAGIYSWFNFEPAYSGLDRGFQTYEDYTVNLPRYLADTQTQALAATYQRLKSYLAIPAAADLDLTLREPVEGTLDGKADITATAASRWLEKRRGDPFFLWVHFYDPHAPYTAPTSNPNDLSCQGCLSGSLDTIRRIRAGASDLSAPEINSVVRAYDSEVSFVDTQIGTILNQLAQLDLDSNTLVIVAGSYGQSFGDHGAWLEGSSVYNAEIQVPLLMKLPGRLAEGKVVTRPTSLIDVLPTIMDVIGIRPPAQDAGRSIFSIARDRPDSERILFSESADSAELAILTVDWKVIRASDGHTELYYLPSDPDEQFDRSESDPEILKYLLQTVAPLQSAQAHLDSERTN